MGLWAYGDYKVIFVNLLGFFWRQEYLVSRTKRGTETVGFHADYREPDVPVHVHVLSPEGGTRTVDGSPTDGRHPSRSP